MNLTKNLIKGNLSMIILKLLESEGEMYGYQLSQRIHKASQGIIDIKFGSLYPALHKLKAEGIVGTRETFEGQRKRVYYFLTKKGKDKTIIWSKEYLSFHAMINHIMNLNPT